MANGSGFALPASNPTTCRSCISAGFILVILLAGTVYTCRRSARRRCCQPNYLLTPAADRLLPRHRRRRHDGRHPARPHRPLGALDDDRRRHDGDHRRRADGDPHRPRHRPPRRRLQRPRRRLPPHPLDDLHPRRRLGDARPDGRPYRRLRAADRSHRPDALPRRRQDSSASRSRSIVWAGISIIIAGILARTAFGKSIYATGNREAAAYLSGIRTRWVIVGAFAISGVCAAAAGLLLAGYSDQGLPEHGQRLPAAGDRRGRDRRHAHPRRPRPLHRHRGRRDPDRAAQLGALDHADARGRPADHLRRS